MVSIRNQPPTEVHRTGQARVPTTNGTFTAYSYLDLDRLEHLAYVAGDPLSVDAPLVRVHSECLTGDVLGSLRCDCGSQLAQALALVGGSKGGVVVYARGHEGRGIGLGHKLQAYQLQDAGLDTVDANHALGFPTDARDYGIAAAILSDLGLTRVSLLSNNPAKLDGLAVYGIEIAQRVPLHGIATSENGRYLDTKRDRMDHILNL